MPPLAAPEDLAARCDINVLAQLVGDDDVELSRQDTLGHANMLTALRGASGRVRSSLRTRGQYTDEQLDAIIAGSSDDDKEHLKDIVVAFAIRNLLRRRVGVFRELEEFYATETAEYIKELMMGIGIIGDGGDSIEDRQDASMIGITGPTTIDLNRVNDTANKLSGHYLSDEANWLPRGRG